MALRIGGPKKGKEEAPAPVEEPTAAPEEMAAEPMPEEVPMEEPAPEMAPEMATGGPLDPAVAGYKGPELGPFMCGNCEYYSLEQPNTCAVVSGFIDESGICNIFKPMELPEEGADAPMEEAPMPEEAAPAATPPPEEEPPAM